MLLNNWTYIFFIAIEEKQVTWEKPVIISGGGLRWGMAFRTNLWKTKKFKTLK